MAKPIVLVTAATVRTAGCALLRTAAGLLETN
jgi:hypothetical protein